MPDRIKQFLFYFSYWLDAVDEHSLHSPFFYDFYTKVIKPKTGKGNPLFEKLRKQLRENEKLISFVDLGSGKGGPQRLSQIAKNSLSPLSCSLLYSRIAAYFNAKSILELGTSLGINTLYLSERKGAKVTTLEGVPEIAEIAAGTFAFAGMSNIGLVRGNIDVTLPDVVQSLRQIDLALLDANHRHIPTVSYFEKMVPALTQRSVVIVDDIHYSAEMERAWKELQQHKLVYGSADLYRFGVLFFDPSLNKQHVILQS